MHCVILVFIVVFKVFTYSSIVFFISYHFKILGFIFDYCSVVKVNDC